MEPRPTKRQVLSEIAKLYDPNGFLSPVIISAKIIMQDIWRLGIGWDVAIPAEIQVRWDEFYNSLMVSRLQEIRLPRWFGMLGQSRVQLHGFADASSKAYGAVIYVRTVDDAGEVRCQLVVSKSRVAPTATVSIPRLELQAAELLGRLLRNTVETCEFKNVECFCWSDSTVVLHWLRKQPCDMKTFVANRVASIQTTTEVSTWAHVVSADNPADLLSRGLAMCDFIHSDLWYHGPEWLTQPQAQWPESKLSLSQETANLIEAECKPMESLVVLRALKSTSESLIYKHGSWDKVMRITAYALRFIANCRKKVECRVSGKMLTQADTQAAVDYWVRMVQSENYPKEIECRKKGLPLPGNSKIAGLNPQLNADGVLCVGGRLEKADCPDAQKHQVIIPARTRLGWMLLHKAHRQTLHGGVQMMIKYIRTAFWVPRLRFEECLYHSVQHAFECQNVRRRN